MVASKPAETRQRRNKSSTRTVLSMDVDHGVPMMPPANEWIQPPAGLSKTEAREFSQKIRWSPHVVKWWQTIWSSPMSNEYHDSDNVQLYLAAYYLQLCVDPTLKPGERLQAARQHENCVKQFGLSPMSRRALQWEIAKADEATASGRERARRRAAADKARGEAHEAEDDPRENEDFDEPNPFHTAPRAG